MVDKVTLANVASFQNDTSAVSTVNNNMALITTAMDNTLSRDGTTPNTMSATLDMNSNQIINLPPPAGSTSPARLIDVVSNPTLLLTVPPTGTSGHTVPFLDTSVSWSAANTQTFNGQVAFASTTLNPTFATGVLQFTNFTVNNNLIGFNRVPTRYFDIQGSTTANSQNSVRFKGFQVMFEIVNQAATQNYYFGIDDSDSNKLKIGTGTSGSFGTPFITGLSTGFLAINSAIPTSSDRLLIEDNTGASQLKVRFTGKSGVQLLQSTTGACTFNVIDNNSLLIGTNNVIQATLFPSGGFGIGNASGDPGVNNIGAIGQVRAFTTTATVAGGSTPGFIQGSSGVGVYIGTGAPSISAAKGSIYTNTTATTTTTRMYINTDGAGTWTTFTTAA